MNTEQAILRMFRVKGRVGRKRQKQLFGSIGDVDMVVEAKDAEDAIKVCRAHVKNERDSEGRLSFNISTFVPTTVSVESVFSFVRRAY